MNNTFKNNNGQHILLGLFYETALEKDKDYVVYTLKQYDHEGYPSLHRLYLECDDPTEYKFANTYFDNWQHWKKVRECSWFKPYLDAMREELEISIASRALVGLRQSASDPKSAVQVNKYLLEKGYKDKDDKRGRPSKETIKSEADKMFKDASYVKEDWARLNG